MQVNHLGQMPLQSTGHPAGRQPDSRFNLHYSQSVAEGHAYTGNAGDAYMAAPGSLVKLPGLLGNGSSSTRTQSTPFTN